MLPIVWTETADEDLAGITEYIGESNISAAERMWHRLRSCVLPLSSHPYLYPISDRIPGLREVVAHPNYIILYRVTATRVEIINVVHARRQFPG
ncbi:type II toxin-antitoxin system mRNA interferase toxin, RelE/StbE family [Acetobacter lambici]|uniref:Type II toxin-antitoxin system RelE/ParE family toxin n=1 Tax=Acetobacter lambici TaxID=1332824 RepID=A0ABT1F3A6_9PROT|nr:type II toxin-antitoxin system RelE/ParE family toxin [Acetobacter lambici]MCP1244017.1 type II toxin-antitoxin system RelE/ParE family toxin [Acetobacter lambici]MCP1259673.1 type II toxin-antitoxin system RelE/ParE family toxin [Acetobacter lambici]MCP1259690.1 type II toxin-antitoxin system RelE/ParE family toxin [Acetobacter lambici]NHO58214.1 type II toxin-antitoxin system mRNA interferase toxin, RelE/StbE family [Acetobacter lambici]